MKQPAGGAKGAKKEHSVTSLSERNGAVWWFMASLLRGFAKIETSGISLACEKMWI